MTYLGLAALFLVPAAVLAVAAAVLRGLGARWWATTGVVVAVLVLLTVVFDSLMVAADLFRYGEGALSGLRLWLAPLEDLAWPVAAALALPALWELLGRRAREPVSAADGVEEER
ncbi:lycopene cyclase domain-containing protein [Georgenia subflava]|uniref:Lycopene cyclase domain-containing protein n=1 Tax=Georgenia subflava TaxID=1622177 RepID=A0A6N7ELC6_9MICO|nr:lycopene cyclase domain-containing protein [Georgenia subflava]MPV37863.1 lycopene cyclase domain-containing protein [Georgenia subflava]